MIRRSPCELYLKYLLALPDNLDNEQIRKICRQQQLDYVSDYVVDSLRSSMVRPVPYYPLDERHTRSSRFLLKHRITRFFFRDEHMLLADSLLEHAPSKSIIEELLIGRADTLWISSVLKKKGMDATVTAIDYFRRFYFNVDLVDQTELVAILKLRYILDGGNKEELSEWSAMYRSMSSDPRIAAAECPVTQMALLMSTLRLGYMPKNADLASTAALGRFSAALQGTTCVIRGGFKDHERGRDYALTAKTFNDLIESVGGTQADFSSQLTALMLKTETKTTPNIHELSDGNHTTDLQPVSESENAE